MGNTFAELSELRARFEASARQSSRRAPLYARLAAGVADDPALLELVRHAPPPQRLPVLLFACVHWMLLTQPGHELARWYPGLSDRPEVSDPFPAFRSFCLEHRVELVELLGTRSTQTNEVGRCSLVLPWAAQVADELDAPLVLVDVGTSAGLTLGIDRYRYRYEPEGVTVGDPSPVSLTCGLRGAVPVPRGLPVVAARIGLDRDPVDLDDPDAIAWLRACVWPDQLDRARTLRSAIEVVRELRPEIRTADAVDGIAPILDEYVTVGHRVVTTTWMLNYLTGGERRRFMDRLDEVGTAGDLTWILAESPALTAELGIDHDPTRADLTHVVVVTWRGGHREQRTVATAHPHGYWMHATPR